ncbi:hypothetical protein TNCV_5014991 [Trichonephila clavipes]|nr:hypothetical protein TNCV_5014991 [Trichonephila clavipes]
MRTIPAPILPTSISQQREDFELDRFNTHHPLYSASLQCHQDSNLRHFDHEFMTITTRLPFLGLVGLTSYDFEIRTSSLPRP